MFEKTFKAAELSWEGGLRKACRWVIIDENGKIPLLFVSKKKYHKIPWWWMEWDEDKIETLRREIKEEAGCEITDIKEIWTIIEENSNWKQISYCFVWKVVSKSEPTYTDKELEDWFTLKWVDMKNALSTMKSDSPTSENGKCKQEREAFILKKWIEELSKLI